MSDPTRREVETIRKRIDKVNRQLKPLGKNCLKKVRTPLCFFFLFCCFFFFFSNIAVHTCLLRRIQPHAPGVNPFFPSKNKQEKEYKACLEAYNEKSNEKATLVNRLMEVSDRRAFLSGF